MTLAVLRALHAIIADALDDIERFYSESSSPLPSPSPSPSPASSTPSTPPPLSSPFRSSFSLTTSTTSLESPSFPFYDHVYSTGPNFSTPPASPGYPTLTPRSNLPQTPKPILQPNVLCTPTSTHLGYHTRSNSSPQTPPNSVSNYSQTSSLRPDFPSLDTPYDPTSLSEQLTTHPTVVAAINKIVAACGQMAAIVQKPFLTLCDASMGVSCFHPSCRSTNSLIFYNSTISHHVYV
jgi:hypothetical protein